MKLEDFPEIKFITSIQEEMNRCMSVYRRDHPQFRCFDFPEHFYFKIYNDRLVIHWAVILKEEYWSVYFINMRGRAFDKLVFKTKKQAQRALRRNKFSFSTNKYCPYKPISPIYINIGEGKKSAPYSKGKLWDFYLKTQRIIEQNVQKGMTIKEATVCMVKEHTELFSRMKRKNWNKPPKKVIEHYMAEMEKNKPLPQKPDYTELIMKLIQWVIIILVILVFAGW